MTTRRTRTMFAVLVAAPATATTVAGCGDGPASFAPPAPTASAEARVLVGTWRTTSESLQPQGLWERTLVVHSDMRVEHRGAMYGIYPGEGAKTLSASFTLYGRLGATATKFVIHPDSVVTRDLFYGPGYRQVQRDFPNSVPSDSTTYEVRDGVLSLTFYSYPADAPVLTQAIYYRVK